MKESIQPAEDPIVSKQIEFLGKHTDSLANPAWFVDVNTYQITRINIAARAVGIKADLPCYQALWGLNEPCDVIVGHYCHIKELRKGKKKRDFKIQEHTLKDGYKRILETYHYPIFGKDGQLAQVMTYCDEISERIGLEKLYEEMEEYYHTLTGSRATDQFTETNDKSYKEVFKPTIELKLWTWNQGLEGALVQSKIELEALKQAERFKTELLSVVSHELRTPLTSIKGSATSLLRPHIKWNRKEQEDFIQNINQETDRLNRLIGDLLDMSRLEAGLLKLQREQCRVSDLLESIRGELSTLTKQHQLGIAIPQELPMVYIDEMRIGQVITNLVENATRFSDSGSKIKIEAKPGNGQVIISVTDNGVGIPVERLEKVFDRFYSSEDAIGGQRKGLGLGLSISRGIIESHGGKIWAESKPEQGSKFSFSLPVGKNEGEFA